MTRLKQKVCPHCHRTVLSPYRLCYACYLRSYRQKYKCSVCGGTNPGGRGICRACFEETYRKVRQDLNDRKARATKGEYDTEDVALPYGM